jgi:ribosome-associated protein
MTDIPHPQPPPNVGLEITPGVFIPHDNLRFAFARSSGPGGQNVNKLNTKAELWVPLTSIQGLAPDAIDRLARLVGKRLTKENEIHITAETARTQERNKEAALERLRELILQAKTRPKPRRATKPSKGSKRRRLEAKKHRGEIKRLRRNE